MSMPVLAYTTLCCTSHAELIDRTSMLWGTTGLTNTSICCASHAEVLDGTGLLVLMHKSSRQVTDVSDATSSSMA